MQRSGALSDGFQRGMVYMVCTIYGGIYGVFMGNNIGEGR